MNKKTISVEEIRELAFSAQLNNIQTLFVKNNDTTVKIKCSAQPIVKGKQAVVKAQKHEKERNIIKSPAVGILYLIHPLQDKALILLNDTVHAGQIVAFVKMGAALIPVKSEFNGFISKICHESGSVVEFGQSIFEIE